MSGVYLDNNATTAVAPEVVEALLPFLRGQYHNPSAPYPAAAAVADAVQAARAEVARLVGTSPRNLTFTSGGSEGITAALSSARRSTGRSRAVVSAVEHAVVRLEAEAGGEVTTVPVDGEGRLDREGLFAAIDDSVAVVSLMLANNETGVLTDLEGVGEACRRVGAVFHLDAVQGPGKLPVDLPATGAHLATLSGHKLHAPKGIGALYVADDADFRPLLLGGGQEQERRAGTENVPGIVGLGAAARLAREHAADPAALETTAALRDRLEAGALARVPGARVHGAQAPRLGNTTNLLLPGHEARTTLLMLAELGVEASAGSACSAHRAGPSPVLLAMGLGEEEASRSLRFSLSRWTSEAEVDRALEALEQALETLDALG